MRTAALTVGATVLLTATVAVSAEAISTHPSAHRHLAAATTPGALDTAITDLKPYAYWPLNGTNADAAGHDGAFASDGSGSAVGHSTSNPPGATGGSIAFHPGARQTGQYLRGTNPAVPPGTAGTVVLWFRAPKTLPPWWQTIAVDNGAGTTRYGGFPQTYGYGFFINNTGRLVLSCSTGQYFDTRANFGPRRRYESGPLNDGKWHMVAYVDQDNINIDENGHARPPQDWLPSLLYVDGALVDNALEGRLLDAWAGWPKSRILLGAGTQPTQAAWLGRFTGNLSHLALFDRLLTANEVAGIWQAGN